MKRNLDAYVDGGLSTAAQFIARLHLRTCSACFERYEQVESFDRLALDLAAPPPPAQLRTQLRVAVSYELAREGSWRRSWAVVKWRFRESFQPVALRAAGGFTSALLLFGVVMPDIASVRTFDANDVPLTYLAKQFVAPPSIADLAQLSSVDAKNLTVLAYVGVDGGLYDLELPEELRGDHKLRAELANALLFTQFEPATKFGQPILGRVLISFTTYTVKG